MSKKTYENLKEMLNYELDGLTKRGDINKDTLDSIHKLISSIYKLDGMCKEEESMNEGYSMRQYSRHMPMGGYPDSWSNTNMSNRSYDMQNSNAQNSYEQGRSNAQNSYENVDRSIYEQSNARAGRDGDGDGRYSEDNSYRRGRDARGRYTSRDGNSYNSYDQAGYSGHSAKDRVVQRLETMLDEAQSESEKLAIMRCIEKIQD